MLIRVFSKFLNYSYYFIDEFLIFIFDVPAFAFSVSIIFCVGFFYLLWRLIKAVLS